MAISRVTANDCTGAIGNANSTTATYPQTPVAGNLLISIAYFGNSLFANVTPPSGWTVINHENTGSGTLCVVIAAKISAGNESVVTWSFTGTTNSIYIDQHEYTGNVLSPLSDQAPAGANSGGSTATSQSTGTTGTTAVASELVITAVGLSGSSTAQAWTNATHLFSNNFLFTGERFVSATGAYTDTLTWTTLRVSFGCMTTFEAAAVGPAPPLAVRRLGR